MSFLHVVLTCLTFENYRNYWTIFYLWLVQANTVLSGLNWDIKRASSLRRQGHAGPTPNTESKIKVLPSVNSNLHPRCPFICWIDRDSATYFSLKCGVGLLSACWELAQCVQLYRPSDLKIVYTDKLRLLLSENWDFTSFEGDVRSHTSKGFGVWVDLGTVPTAEGD